MSAAVIPNRPVFRAQEVCEIADVQPYVLRSWEAEFPDLGVSKTAAGPRIYRRGDVEKVLRLKHLLFVDGLTLAGARKQLLQEGAARSPEPIEDADVAAMLDAETRQSLRDIRGGLQWILGVLSGHGTAGDQFTLRPQPVVRASGAARKASAPARGKVTKKPAKKRRG
jgi:DNA-binding transcriptional MerR regulator